MKHADPDTGVADSDQFGLTCPNCHPTVTFNPAHRQRIVEHIGAHILYDPSVNRLSEPCGLCLRPAPHCKIVLKKAKGQSGKLAIDMNASSCPNLVKFSMAIASACSNASPCTNHPLACPYCDDSELDRVVWSYNFRQHLLRKHPRISLDDQGDILTLTKLEKKGMKRIWKGCNKRRHMHRKTQNPPLMISETHRSRLVLRYGFLQYFINDSTDAQPQSSDAALELQTSDEDSSTASDSGSDREEEGAESGGKGVTLVMTETDLGRVVQEPEHGSE